MITLLEGHVLDLLRTLPSARVQACITSPPYWGLRDYQLPPQVWDDPGDCAHVWGKEILKRIGRHDGGRDIGGRGGNYPGEGPHVRHAAQGATCQRCQAWYGSLGLEPSVDLYVSHLVQVFRAVKRVLRDDGTLWLNLGDSYNAGTTATRAASPRTDVGYWQDNGDGNRRVACPGLKPKDLVGLPWRVAFALQADGWTLRSDIIWHKSNPMPESVRDRPTRAHEYVFLLTKRGRYYYDAEAIRERTTSDAADPRRGDGARAMRARISGGLGMGAATHMGVPPQGRNKRSVWTLATQPYPGAHFATFSPKLVEPCLLAGTSAHGCCATCGAPWVRQITCARAATRPGHPIKADASRRDGARADRLMTQVRTLGWRPSCRHDAPVIPCTVLDPFAGAGTVGLVALRTGRDAVLLELSAAYAAQIRARLGLTPPPLFQEAAD